MFLFFLEIVKKYELQFLNLPTASSNHARVATLSLIMTVRSHQFSNVVKIILKNVKNCSPSRQDVKTIL